MPDDQPPERNYCYFLDHRKYNRNLGCRLHDNAYGINGGGSERDRWAADRALYERMKHEGDPMAAITLLACLCYGWFFYNYRRSWPWRGQLVRLFVKAKH